MSMHWKHRLISAAIGLGCLGLGVTLGASGASAKRHATPTSCKGKKWSKARFSHRLYNGLLKKYVRNGLVNYNGLRKQRKKLDKYLCRLAHTDVKKIKKRSSRFAFWINAYNAVTLRAVLDRLPNGRGAQKNFSVAKGAFNFWKGHKYQVSGRWYSLDQIENGVIRPRFRDPRLHFALVCAARGCPHLASRSYTGSRLYGMLNRNTRKYLASANGAKLDRGAKAIYLSKLFQWYRKDFINKRYKHPLLFVAKYAPKGDRQFIRKHYKSLKIKWIPYSWKLNVR